MKTLLKNGTILNVFTDTLEKSNVLIEDTKIIGVGDYGDDEADKVIDVTGKVLCPGFVDGHIHIESTMLTPWGLANVSLPHGTTTIFADPHEIANVCGVPGIKYMIEMSEGLPLNVNIMLPSCVPATPFDEAGAVLSAEDLEPLYDEERVYGLAEMMNYPGLIGGDPSVVAKVVSAKAKRRAVDGHAPMLRGKELDKYLSYGIGSDHECSDESEAKERISKGQYIMVREGTAAKNLDGLFALFEEPWNHRAILCTDDRHPADLLSEGHIDNVVRRAISKGVSPAVAIRMATIQPAQYFGLIGVGAIAPGFRADILVFNDLASVDIKDVFASGALVVEDKAVKPFDAPVASAELDSIVRASFHMDKVEPGFLKVDATGVKTCRVIDVVPGQLLTNEAQLPVDFDNGNNGIDVESDILKLAVIERHHGTGHRGVGYIRGIGLRAGAIAATVSHDSHNLIVIGTNDADMECVANYIREIGGGSAIALNGEIVASMPLPIAGLMTDKPADVIAEENEALRAKVREIGVNDNIEPFMNMAFVSLPVIPSLKMSTQGLVDVDHFSRVDLFV
ncbi:MAG: adenine deaminase [Oscillospiraceae bacterium]|nr:adenine deaminase [Candidatus Limimonas egerieequi]